MYDVILGDAVLPRLTGQRATRGRGKLIEFRRKGAATVFLKIIET